MLTRQVSRYPWVSSVNLRLPSSFVSLPIPPSMSSLDAVPHLMTHSRTSQFRTTLQCSLRMPGLDKACYSEVSRCCGIATRRYSRHFDEWWAMRCTYTMIRIRIRMRPLTSDSTAPRMRLTPLAPSSTHLRVAIHDRSKPTALRSLCTPARSS